MKLKSNFLISELLDDFVAISVQRDETGCKSIINLNDTAKDIFMLLQEGKDEDAVVAGLLDIYDVTPDIARTEVKRVIDLLKENDLIEE